MISNTDCLSRGSTTHLWRRLILPLLCLGLLAGYGVSAAAASLMAYAQVEQYDQNYNPIPINEDGDSICWSYTGTTGLTGCIGSFGFAGSTLSYQASADVDYGQLRVYGSGAISRPHGDSNVGEGPDTITSAGTAIFRDQWTFFGEPAGTTGTLELTFHITGVFDYSQGGLIHSFGMHVFGPGGGFRSPNPSFPWHMGSSGVLDYVTTISTPIVFGTTLDFQVILMGGASLSNLQDGGFHGQNAYMDLSNTAVMSAIVVRDGAMNEIPFALLTESNAPIYSTMATIVPVPAAVWLFGSALGLLGWLRRRPGAR